MKRKMALNSQLDLNAAFNGGVVDTSVTYYVPVMQQDVITVSATGIVEAVGVGTATVEVYDVVSGEFLRAVVFQVLTETDYDVQASLDSALAGGSGTDLLISYVEPSGSNNTNALLPNMISNNSGSYHAWLLANMNIADSYLYGNLYMNVESSTGQAYEAFDNNYQSGGVYALSNGGLNESLGVQTVVDAFLIGLAFPIGKTLSAVEVKATGHGDVQVTVQGIYESMILSNDQPDWGASWVTLGTVQKVSFGAESTQVITVPTTTDLTKIRKLRVIFGFYSLDSHDSYNPETYQPIITDKGYITVHNITPYFEPTVGLVFPNEGGWQNTYVFQSGMFPTINAGSPVPGQMFPELNGNLVVPVVDGLFTAADFAEAFDNDAATYADIYPNTYLYLRPAVEQKITYVEFDFAPNSQGTIYISGVKADKTVVPLGGTPCDPAPGTKTLSITHTNVTDIAYESFILHFDTSAIYSISGIRLYGPL